MDFEFSEEQRIFRDAVRGFAEKEIAPIVKEAEEKESCPLDLFSKMGRLSYLCPGYPPQYGGGGLGEIGTSIMVEELAKVSSGIASGLMVQSGLSTFSILAHGTESQKKKFLVPAIRGDKIAAFGLTESDAGSDASAIRTTARREGDHYVVNGSKIYITNGPICDFVTLATTVDRSKGVKGITTLVVERKTPGLSVTKLKKLGHNSAATGEMVFEDCRVPAENLVGEEGKGYKYMLEALNPSRITHSARSLGLAEAAFDATLRYAKERQQFGQPIGKFQAIAFKLARMAVDIEAAKWLLYRVAWLYDRGDECRKEAPMTKVFSSEIAIRTAEEAMRIHAGAGYMAESPIQRYFREAILYHSTEGTTEIQQMVISRELGL